MATLLVVEENPGLGQLYTQFFVDMGLDVVRTTRCEQTLTWLAKLCIPDVIILDLGLSDGSGLSIIQHVRSHPRLFSQTQLVILVGNEKQYAFSHALRLDHIFYKPVSFHTLGKYVERLLLQ